MGLWSEGSVEGEVTLGDVTPAIAGFDQAAAVERKLAGEIGVLEEADSGFGQGGAFGDEAVVTVAGGDSVQTEGGGDNGTAHRQGFKDFILDACAQAERADEGCGTGEVGADIGDAAGDTDGLTRQGTEFGGRGVTD
jgi:hypothetical protein